mgnify:FL=1
MDASQNHPLQHNLYIKKVKKTRLILQKTLQSRSLLCTNDDLFDGTQQQFRSIESQHYSDESKFHRAYYNIQYPELTITNGNQNTVSSISGSKSSES